METTKETLKEAEADLWVDSIAAEEELEEAMASLTPTTATQQHTNKDGQHTSKVGEVAGKGIITLLL